jgi:hypothetical protein
VGQEVGAGALGRHQLAQAGAPEHRTGGVVRLHDPVAVEEDALARGEDRRVLRVVHPGQEAQGHAGRPQLDHTTPCPDARQVVTGVRVHDPAGRRLQDHVQAGDEHPGGHLGQEDLVCPLQDPRRRDQPWRLTPEDGLGPGHDQRRRDALVRDVTHHDPEPAVRQRDEVVEVSADRPGRAVVRRHLPVGQLGQLARQELLLDEGRDAHLLLEALPGLDLHGLFADQLGDPDRRRRLGPKGGEERAVVPAVALVRQPGAQVQGADELALGDERDDDPDAGTPELREGGRVELEVLGIDHPTGGLEVGEERVRRGDLDGGPHRGEARAVRHGSPPDRRIQRPRVAGATVRLTTPRTSALTLSRSTSSRSWVTNAATARSAS